jgi:hypothetical protein
MTNIKLTPQTWEATPYGEHWSFAYNLANIEREEYDFTVEFHDTIDEAEQKVVISLIEAAPDMLAELAGLSEIWSKAEFGTDVMDYLESRIHAIRAAIAKATADIPASERSGIDIDALLAKRQQIAAIWSIEDVQQNRPDLSDDDAWEVLQAVKHDHDCNYGITWQTLDMAARHLFPEPPAAEAAAEA